MLEKIKSVLDPHVKIIKMRKVADACEGSDILVLGVNHKQFGVTIKVFTML